MKFLDRLCTEDDEIVDKVIYDEYWYLMRISNLYQKLNTTKLRAFSIFQFIFYVCCISYHALLYVITAVKISTDAMETFQNLHYLLLNVMATYLLVLINKRRSMYAKIHRAMGTGLSNYDEETNKIRKTLVEKTSKEKMMLMKVLLPYFSSIVLLMLALAKYLDNYSGADNVEVASPSSTDKLSTLPIAIWIPFDTNNLIGYSVALFMLTLNCAIILIIYTCGDLTLFVMCHYLAMEFRLLIISLERLPERTLHLYRLRYGNNTNNVSTETLKENKTLSNCYKDCLKQNLMHHQKIIELFYLYRDMFALILTLTFMAFSVITAFSGALVIKGEGRIGSRILSGLFCLAEITIAFFISYCCSQISYASEDLISTLYSTKWMTANKNEIQMIQIMMIRSQSPLMMNYRCIVTFDYASFSTLMNTAYSYFNILLAFL